MASRLKRTRRGPILHNTDPARLHGAFLPPMQPAPQPSGSLLEFAAEIAQFGGWEVELATRQVWWSEQLFKIFELPVGSCPALEDAFALCTSESRALISGLFDACIGEGKAYDANLEAVTVGGRRIWVRAVGRAVRDEGGAIVRIQGACQDITRQRHLESTSLTLSRRLSSTLNSMGEAFFTLGPDLRFDYLNPAAARMLHRGREELLGKKIWAEFPQAVGGTSYREYSRALREKIMVAFEEYYAPLARWFEARCYPFEDGIAVYFHDITDQKLAQEHLQQANRALQMLSRSNDVLVRAAHERDLIEQICSIAVETGGYRMAWVGYAGAVAKPSITVAAHAGAGSPGGPPPRWLAQAEAGQGPAGLALRQGAPVVIGDMAADTRFMEEMAAAVTRGNRGAIFLPMRDDTGSFAVLALYSADPLRGDADELRLLKELTDNVAFGIRNIRAREAQKKFEASLIKVAASVSSSTGERFFEQLATAMAQSVGADGGFIARLLPSSPLKARTVVGIVDGKRIADFDYLVDDSPCGCTLRQQHYVLTAGLPARYPDSPVAALGAHAYGGWRLADSSGAELGIVSVVFRQPVAHSGFVTSALQIFAARAAAELERQDKDAQMRAQATLLDKAQDGIVVRGLDDRIMFWNKSAERMYGWTREEALGRNVQELLTDDIGEFEVAKRTTLDVGYWDGEVARHRKDGSETVVELRLSLIKNDNGEVQGILSISTDISHRKAAERQIEQLAFYDPLTALPNRLLLLDRLQHALVMCGRSGATGALMLIDIDQFKTINDTLGHDNGDQMLKSIAQRLRARLYGSDSLARFGGDEFMVMVENLSEQQHEAARQATVICQKILGVFDEAILLGGVARKLTASVGVTLFGKDSANASELLKQTDLAMYEVKAAGRNGMRFFDPVMQTEIMERTALEHDLHAALAQQEFVLHYQPQVDDTGRVTGAEALVRWQSPSRGCVPPDSFIPIAEESGLIVPLGRWILESACAQAARWASEPAFAGLTISVNVSVRQLRQPDFVTSLLAILASTGAEARNIKLEITESLLMDDSEQTIAMMRAAKTHGIGFSLDDFGTGYSSLSYLKRLPLDQLKIDRSFVLDVIDDTYDAAIARTIVELGRHLGLHVIAEGVETAAQRELLAEYGCKGFQGYLFCRPVPASEFEDFVLSHSGVAANLS